MVQVRLWAGGGRPGFFSGSVQVLKELEYLFPFLASMCLSVNEVASWIPLVPQAVARSPISCVLGIP